MSGQADVATTVAAIDAMSDMGGYVLEMVMLHGVAMLLRVGMQMLRPCWH